MGKPPGMNRAFVNILAALFTYFMETNNFRWVVFLFTKRHVCCVLSSNLFDLGQADSDVGKLSFLSSLIGKTITGDFVG